MTRRRPSSLIPGQGHVKISAALFGYLLAGERLSGRALAGCALILAGMVAAELRIGAAEERDGDKWRPH